MISLEEVRKMRDEGRSDEDVMGILRRRGESQKEVYSALTQAQIKDAVDSNEDSQSSPPSTKSIPGFPEVPKFTGQSQESDSQTKEYSGPISGNDYGGMEASIVTQEQTPIKPSQISSAYDYAGELAQNPQGQPQQQYPQYDPSQQYQQQYPQYEPYQGALSTDVVSEIAEQIVSEKLSYVEEKLIKAIDFRTVAEAKIASISDRLKRIESVLDTIQISVLQKVGSYVNDVTDLKKELVETQKSFTSLLPQMKKHEHPHEAHPHKEHEQSHHQTPHHESHTHHPEHPEHHTKNKSPNKKHHP